MASMQPPSASSSPRFCNTGSFMRMPRMDDPKGMDFAVFGIPFDTGSSYRTGSRFGPSAIRHISSMIKPNNVIFEVNILNELTGGWVSRTQDWLAEALLPLYDTSAQ